LRRGAAPYSGRAMKIYTKSGDAGDTGLFGGPRVPKDDARVEAYGAVDELNAALGVARARGGDADLDALLAAVQDQLFAVGAELATPPGAKARSALPPIDAAWTAALERAVDRFEEDLAPLRQFVLPGGAPLAAELHRARCICRRAERRVVALHHGSPVAAEVLAYLNRLSDFLFVAARVANHRAGVAETLWNPHPGR
jgi:cob(I)alamin adenosyltransferase